MHIRSTVFSSLTSDIWYKYIQTGEGDAKNLYVEQWNFSCNLQTWDEVQIWGVCNPGAEALIEHTKLYKLVVEEKIRIWQKFATIQLKTETVNFAQKSPPKLTKLAWTVALWWFQSMLSTVSSKQNSYRQENTFVMAALAKLQSLKLRAKLGTIMYSATVWSMLTTCV